MSKKRRKMKVIGSPKEFNIEFNIPPSVGIDR